ncbi:hypothetical protein ACWCQQ_37820 [Streptomyces sp. NPDC002143]
MSQLNGEPERLHETHEIPPPDPDFEPLKVSLYERMSQGGAQLIPLFPYDRSGSIVPCAAILMGGLDKGYGHFFHWNTVDEVTVSYGASGSMLKTGTVFTGQNLHGVNSFLEDEKDPDKFVVVVITVHQPEAGAQDEAMIARCAKCKEEIVRNAYDSTPLGVEGYASERYGAEDDVVHHFPTILGSAEFADIRNTDAGRTCKACGHVNDLFPAQAWGWNRVVHQTNVVNAARRALVEAGQAQKKQEKVS